MNFTLFIQRTQVFFWITVKMIINCSKSQILCLLLNWFLCLLGKVNHFQYKSWRDYWWKNRWKFAKKGKNYFLKNIFRLSPREISDAIHHKAKTGEKMPTSNAVVAGGRSGVFNSSAYNKVTVLQLAISLCLPADFYLAILFVINSSRCDFFVSVEVVSFVMTPTTTNACLLAWLNVATAGSCSCRCTSFTLSVIRCYGRLCYCWWGSVAQFLLPVLFP